jgi:hypothetical protein
MTDDALRRLERHSVEIHCHFDITVERIENEVQRVAEAVVRIDQKLDRRAVELMDCLERGFRETEATIRLFDA